MNEREMKNIQNGFAKLLCYPVLKNLIIKFQFFFSFCKTCIKISNFVVNLGKSLLKLNGILFVAYIGLYELWFC